MQSNKTTCHLRKERGGYKEEGRKVMEEKRNEKGDLLKQRERKGCGLAESLLLFTNIFISSLFTLMWLTVVCCSMAISSSSSSSSSSSNGLEPTGAVIVGTVRLTTWGTVRDGLLTCTHTHTHTKRHTFEIQTVKKPRNGHAESICSER